MIDLIGRQKLENAQNTKTLQDGLDKVVEAIKETSVVTKPQTKTPANDLADELRNLQRTIGGGNLTESLSKLSQALDSFDVNENAVGQLKALVADMTAKLKLLADLEAKIPKDIDLNFPEEVQVAGKVEVGTVDSLPPVVIQNIGDLAKALSVILNNLQVATIKAIERSKPEFPERISIINKVKIDDFQTLLDDMEELKKGFNTLINKEIATVSFPSTTIPVEIKNWMIPQPVTNVNINPLQGFVKTTSATVGTTVTQLPSYGQLFNRRSVLIYNNSSNTIYIGGSDVTTTTGIPVPASSYAPILDAGYNLIVYGIASQTGNNVRILEVSKDKSDTVQQ